MIWKVCDTVPEAAATIGLIYHFIVICMAFSRKYFGSGGSAEPLCEGGWWPPKGTSPGHLIEQLTYHHLEENQALPITAKLVA